MKIVVTGGAGFVGSNFIFYISDRHPNYEIVCIDALTYAGSLETLALIMDRPSFQFYQADITDAKTIRDIFCNEKPDIVVNFAAESHVDRSIQESEIFMKTNLIGTQVLLDACRMFGIKRFHQISTDEVYGDLPYGSKDIFSEGALLRPSSPYSASKAAADLLTLSYYRTYGLPVSISRSSNNYGLYQHPEKLIPLIITNALKNEMIPVYGTGENIRNWLYVADHCEAIDLIIHKGEAGQIYNVAGQSEMSNLEVIKTILNKMDKPESLIQFVKDRIGHDRRYNIDASKIKNELGWILTTNFSEGLKLTIKWYHTMKKREPLT